MDEWRERLRTVVAGWGLSPEEQAGIVDELEQHLEQELAELRPPTWCVWCSETGPSGW